MTVKMAFPRWIIVLLLLLTTPLARAAFDHRHAAWDALLNQHVVLISNGNASQVNYEGYVYDCDFNQMLQLPLGAGGPGRTHLTELLDRELTGAPIRVADHCYGCTAGQGSSCGGALDAASAPPAKAAA